MSDVASAQGRDFADTLGELGRSRGWLVTYGVLTVIAGALALAWPDVTVFVIAVVVAVQLFVFGVYRLVGAFAQTDSSTGGRMLYAVVGVLSVLVGILCLRDPLQTIAVLAVLLGAFWLVQGLLELFHGAGDRAANGRGWIIFSGVIGVIAGVVVLSYPVASAVVLARLLGIMLIVQGVLALAQALSRTTVAVPVGGAQSVGG